MKDAGSFNLIREMQAPEKFALVSCEIDAIWSPDGKRLYEIERGRWYGYHSKTSGGNLTYHPCSCLPSRKCCCYGPNGEVPEREALFLICEGPGYIGHFDDWDRVLDFLFQMRARNIQILSE